MKWIDVNKQLPKQLINNECSRKVLVYKTDYKGFKSIVICSYNVEQGFWQTQTGLCKITHWQPLPKAPSEDLLSLHVVSSTLCEHNNCSWDKNPNKLKCLDCGKEISRA